MQITFLVSPQSPVLMLRALIALANSFIIRGHRVVLSPPISAAANGTRSSFSLLRPTSRRHPLGIFTGEYSAVNRITETTFQCDYTIATDLQSAQLLRKLTGRCGKKILLGQSTALLNCTPQEATEMKDGNIRILSASEFLKNELEKSFGISSTTLPFRGRNFCLSELLGEGSDYDFDIGWRHGPVPDQERSAIHGAIKILQQRFPDLRVMVIGEEYPAGALPQNVQFILDSDARRVRGLYTRTRIWLINSWESQVQSVLPDALGLGCAVVAFRVNGMDSLIEDGRSGYLVEPGDGAALLERLTAVLEYPLLEKNLRFGALLQSQEHSWARCADALERELEEG